MLATFTNQTYGEISIDENVWTGRRTVKINQQVLQKKSKKEYILPDGAVLTIKGNSLMGLQAVIGQEVIQVIPKITWYEILLLLFPFVINLAWGNTVALCKIVPIVGGAIGGAINGVLVVLSAIIMRSTKKLYIKILTGLGALVIGFGACALIAFMILGSI